jgi:hypothetical protein
LAITIRAGVAIVIPDPRISWLNDHVAAAATTHGSAQLKKEGWVAHATHLRDHLVNATAHRAHLPRIAQ